MSRFLNKIVAVLLISFPGHESIPRSRRAIGAIESNIKDFPFMVSLRDVSSSLLHFCGGSIIVNTWILTACHCLINREPHQIRLAVGLTTLEDYPENIYAVKNIFSHPNYSSSDVEVKNDIGLIELKTPLIYSDVIQPIKLGKLENFAEVPVKSAGWGNFIKNRNIQRGDYLRMLQMKTLNIKSCKFLHAKRNNVVDGSSQICAFAEEIGKSLCLGDSGSPLVYNVSGNLVIQIGVFSAIETCDGEFPMLFTRVEAYFDWIKSVIKQNSFII